MNTFIGRRVRITVQNDRLSIFFGIFAKRRSTRFNTLCYWLNLRTQKKAVSAIPVGLKYETR